MTKPFNIQDYLSKNTWKTGEVKKEVGDTPFKGGNNDIRKTNYDVNIVDGKLDLSTHRTVLTESSTLNESMTITEFDDAFQDFYYWLGNNSKYMSDGTTIYLKKAVQFMEMARRNEAEEHGAKYHSQKVKL